MGRSDSHRSHDITIMDTALAYARDDPQARIPFDRIEGARETFGCAENLLLALHRRWMRLLGEQLRESEQAAQNPGTAPESPEAPEVGDDRVDVVSHAWRTTVDRHPTLHAALRTALRADEPHSAALHQAHATELRLLALTSELAEPDEPPDEIAQVGATLLALLRSRDAERPARLGEPVHDRRPGAPHRLVPSA